MGSLEEVFSRSEVMALADPAVYARGVGYFRQGRVEPETHGDGRLQATVRGSVPYTVDLLARIRRLADHAGQPERFDHLLQRVRSEHGRKRNLMKLIDQKGW